MTSYLIADARTTGDGSYLTKLIGTGSGIDEIYVGADVYLCPSVITLFSGGRGSNPTFSQDFFEVWDLYGDGGGTYPESPPWEETSADYEGSSIADGNASGITTPPGWSTEANSNFNDTGGPITSGTHTIQLHLQFSTDTYQYKIDGNLYDLSGMGDLTGWMSQADAVSVGDIFTADGWWDISSITNVTIGTTGFGSTDIVADDFSGGTFALWDDVTGTCSIQSAPVCPRPPAAIVFDGQQAFQVPA